MSMMNRLLCFTGAIRGQKIYINPAHVIAVSSSFGATKGTIIRYAGTVTDDEDGYYLVKEDIEIVTQAIDRILSL